MNMKSKISAALLGGTFAFAAPVFADVPIVQSQADHVATADGAVPLSRQPEVNTANTALMENMLFQLQDLQALVAEQRGIIEELSYQVQVLQQEQKERYVDLDKRIQLLQEKAGSSNLASNNGVSSTTNIAVSDDEILAEYNAAKSLMLDKQFDQSISQLAIFTKKYPDHPLAGNAWYWIGEIYLVLRNTNDAKSAFERIVSDYSEHEKVPDSLYKLGVIAQQAADVAGAKAYFERVLSEYPNTQSAKLSKARLSSN
jgi:tol-pal system protein YbgF